MLRFSIRDLLFLTAIAALAVGWTIERRALETRYARETTRLNGALHGARARLWEAEDLLEFEGVVFGDGVTIHTTPERAAELRAQRAAKPLR